MLLHLKVLVVGVAGTEEVMWLDVNVNDPEEDTVMYENGKSKTVTVPVAGTGKMHQVEVGRETTTKDMLQRMGLDPSEHDVAAPDGSRLLQLDEKPYELIQSAQDTLAVSPSARVG